MELSVRNLPASVETQEKYCQAQADDPICLSAVCKDETTEKA